MERQRNNILKSYAEEIASVFGFTSSAFISSPSTILTFQTSKNLI